jgi:GT2 family glycosyltransferase
MNFEEILAKTDNNYDSLAKTYQHLVGSQLLSEEELGRDKTFQLTASIVIPAFECGQTLEYTLDALKGQDLSDQECSKIEVIIVQDGPGEDLESIIRAASIPFSCRYVVLKQNRGPAFARNVGISKAKGDIVFFLDSDIIVRPSFVREHLVRHDHLPKVVLSGFREHLGLKEWAQGDRAQVPSYKNDFRYYREFKKGGWRLNAPPLEEDCRCSILKETNYFNNFGFAKTAGPCDLPTMVVTTNVSIERKSLLEIGGLHSDLRTFEDTFLGVCLIASGHKIVPVLTSAAFHLVGDQEQAKYNQRYTQAFIEKARNMYANLRQQECKWPINSLIPASKEEYLSRVIRIP